MKILGINFSPRNAGNCFYSLQYSLNKMKEDNLVVEMIHFYELNISPCKGCNYECFDTGCIIEDDLKELYNSCFEADKIIFALPTFCGNLPASYFMFIERSQGIFNQDYNYEELLKKFILS